MVLIFMSQNESFCINYKKMCKFVFLCARTHFYGYICIKDTVSSNHKYIYISLIFKWIFCYFEQCPNSQIFMHISVMHANNDCTCCICSR